MNQTEFDFHERLNKLTTGFVGPERVLSAMENWLVDPNGARVFLLTGGSGSGKTAVVARLPRLLLAAHPLQPLVLNRLDEIIQATYPKKASMILIEPGVL